MLPASATKLKYLRAGGADAPSGLYLYTSGTNVELCASTDGTDTNYFFEVECSLLGGYGWQDVKLLLKDETSGGWGKAWFDRIHFYDAQDQQLVVDEECESPPPPPSPPGPSPPPSPPSPPNPPSPPPGMALCGTPDDSCQKVLASGFGEDRFNGEWELNSNNVNGRQRWRKKFDSSFSAGPAGSSRYWYLKFEYTYPGPVKQWHITSYSGSSSVPNGRRACTCASTDEFMCVAVGEGMDWGSDSDCGTSVSITCVPPSPPPPPTPPSPPPPPPPPPPVVDSPVVLVEFTVAGTVDAFDQVREASTPLPHPSTPFHHALPRPTMAVHVLPHFPLPPTPISYPSPICSFRQAAFRTKLAELFTEAIYVRTTEPQALPSQRQALPSEPHGLMATGLSWPHTASRV